MIDTVGIEISYYLNNSFELIKDSIEEGVVLDDERICYGFWEDKVIKYLRELISKSSLGLIYFLSLIIPFL